MNEQRTPSLMVQGCTSDAGKSLLVTALCRILHRRGIRVAPFKPQNMALNSAVTVDGGEIGRAQALQAQAAGLAAHSDFNPVLLKPATDRRAQVIIHGKALTDLDARDYQAYKPRAMTAVLDSWRRLSQAYECLLVEGAGSPAEINLRTHDIANMGFAEAVDCPVILIADIDRGGVFAHLCGTLDLLSPAEQARVKGFVINRFRGDLGLLESGLHWLEQRTGKPVLGVLPYLHGLYLDAEDAVPHTTLTKTASGLRVVAPAYPRVSNHNDLDPLRFHPEVDFRFVGPNEAPPPCDLIVLPGSKAVQADLAWLRAHGWEQAIRRHLRYGGKLIGICGGLQMLGRELRDPLGLEGAAGTAHGLGYFDYVTELAAEKTLQNVDGHLHFADHPALAGYRIHMGITSGPALAMPAATLAGRPDGALSDDGQILATYCHGLFDLQPALAALLAWAGHSPSDDFAPHQRREADIDRLADAVEQHLDLQQLAPWLPAAAVSKSRRTSGEPYASTSSPRTSNSDV